MFNKFIRSAYLIAGVIGLFGCSTTANVSERLSLEIQEFQTRSFEIDKKTAFSSTISVFQDLGFIINSANYEIGFITADNIDMQIATASFEETDSSIKIRLNFKIKSKSNNNLFPISSNINFIDEKRIYDRFFDKVGETIFIKSANRQNKKVSSIEINITDKPPILEKNITSSKVSSNDASSKNNNISKKIVDSKSPTTPPLATPTSPAIASAPTYAPTVFSTIQTPVYDSYSASFASEYYKTVSGDTLDKIIQKTIKGSPLRIELLREAFVLQNPLKLNLNSRERVKVGIEIKVPKNEFIIPFVMAKNDSSGARMKENGTVKLDVTDAKPKEIEDPNERALLKWKEDSRKWIRFP